MSPSVPYIKKIIFMFKNIKQCRLSHTWTCLYIIGKMSPPTVKKKIRAGCGDTRKRTRKRDNKVYD